MISSIYLKNLKCFSEIEFPVSCFNLFAGINGQGKSTALQSLLLMKQTIEHDSTSQNIVLNGSCIEMGTFYDLKSVNSRIEKGVSIGFDYRQNEDNHFKLKYELADNNIDSSLAKIKRIVVDGVYMGEKFSLIISSTSSLLKIDGTQEKIPDGIDGLNRLFIDSHVYNEAVEFVQDNLNFESLHYISADRIGPKDFYKKHSAKSIDSVGTKGENTVNLLQTYRNRKVNRKLLVGRNNPNNLLDQTEAWLSTIFHGVKLKVFDTSANILTIGFDHKNSGVFFKPINLGFGYSYILPIIVSGLIAKPGEVLIIENPEAHLHSSAQSELLHFLMKVAKTGVQVFIETHSEHILNATRIGVKKDILKPNDVNVLFFQASEEKQIIPVPINHDGKFMIGQVVFLIKWI